MYIKYQVDALTDALGNPPIPSGGLLNRSMKNLQFAPDGTPNVQPTYAPQRPDVLGRIGDHPTSPSLARRTSATAKAVAGLGAELEEELVRN